MIPLLLLLAVGVGQKASGGGTVAWQSIGIGVPPPKRIVLQCPKYQHQVHVPAHCANTCDEDSSTCTAGCLFVPVDDHCADDMHPLKESEYQEMAQHIRDLERNLKAVVCGNMNYQGTISLDSGKTTTDCATLKPDMKRCKDLGNGLCFVENQPSPER